MENTTENKELATTSFVSDEDSSLTAQLSAKRVTAYCSARPETQDQKLELYNATNAPTHRLKEFVNVPISIKDIFCELVDMTNEATGEVTPTPRIVIIDDKGESYACVSNGVFGCLKKIFGACGMPETWGKALTFVPKLVPTKNGKSVMTLEAVLSKKK